MKKRAFRGDDTPAEERAEAKAVKKGAVTPTQYAKKEKAEGEKASEKTLKARGEKLKSGALSEEAYAGMNCGGKVKKMAKGGKVRRMAGGGGTTSSDGVAASRGRGMLFRGRPAMSEGNALGGAAFQGRPAMSEGEALGATLARAQNTNMPMMNRPPMANAPANFTPNTPRAAPMAPAGYKKGGKIDGKAIRGKTKGRIK